MLGRPKAEPKAQPAWEAKADGLTPLGEPFRCGPIEFPPGEWVEVSAGMAQRILLYGWAETRPKAGD